MEETIPVWYTLTGDRICLDDKNLVLLGNEVGLGFNVKEGGSAERSWQLFRWIDEVTRIYY